MRYSSTAAAHERPSAIAQTIRLWPRPMSPATNTSGDVRTEPVVAGDVAPFVELDAELLEQALALRADEAHRQQHQLARQLEVGALDLLERLRPSTIFCSTSWARSARTLPSSSPRKHSVLTAYTRSPPSSCADVTR